MYLCYCISNDTNGKKTYVGSTNNFQRRIRQHNGELVGGARYTTSVGSGWKPVAFALGFRTRPESLSFEWHWKHAGRDRLKALESVLAFPRFSHIRAEIVDDIE